MNELKDISKGRKDAIRECKYLEKLVYDKGDKR